MKTRTTYQSYLGKAAAVIILGISLASNAAAQDAGAVSGVTATSRGVRGDMDKKGRDPQMTITRVISADAVRLIVTAQTPDEELRPYPIRYDFFVNRQLVSSQMTSPELPGDVGLTVTPQMASTPFNYSIVATVLHPNRQFTSVVHGAAFSSDIVGTLACTVTATVDGVERTYRNADVTVTQSGNSQIGFSFLGSEANGGDEALITASVNASASESSGTASVGVNGQISEFTVAGEVVITESTVTKMMISSENGLVIDCDGLEQTVN
jgi:hypothetical protein